MHVVRQWTVQGNHVGAAPAQHPFLAQVGALAQMAAHQASGVFQAGQGEAAADLGGAVSDLLPSVPGLGTKPGGRGASEGGGGAVQWQGDVTPTPITPDQPRQETKPPPPAPGPYTPPTPAATMVTCPDASVHPAGYVCPQSSALSSIGSFMSDWGLWALLGVGAAGGYFLWQHQKKKKAGLGVHDRETIPAWEASGHV